MGNVRNEAKLLKIINYFGLRSQLKKFNEEAFEVIDAVLSEDGIEHIAEEIADCTLLLRQVQAHFGISNEKIEGIVDSKTERTLRRIEGNIDNKA